MIKWREKKNMPENSKHIKLRGNLVMLQKDLKYF